MKYFYFQIKTWIWPLIAVLCFFLAKILERNQAFLETYYSTTLNKWMIQTLSHVTSIVPFSIGIFIYIGHLIAIPILIIVIIYRFFNGGVLSLLRRIMIYISLVYIVFMLLWGFNYSRMSIGEIMELNVEQQSIETLYELNRALIEKANELRLHVDENSEGVMTVSGGYKYVFSRAHIGFDVASNNIEALGGHYGKPKYMIPQEILLYTKIGGMYFPFTAEANVNVGMPDLLIPATTLHEMAHQRGFASEDDANFIAYLTASLHPDSDFQYSGVVLALIYTMSALQRQDAELAEELLTLYGEGLRRDLNHYREFWKEYDGLVDRLSERVNDIYLKGNRQEDGVASYGRMVELLLAYYVKYGEI